MLRGVPSSIPPELLKALCEMGHGSEVVLADGNFPAVDCVSGERIVRCDGMSLPEILRDVLMLFPLDDTTENVVLMSSDDGAEPAIHQKYGVVLADYPDARIRKINRFEFYKRAKGAYVVLITGEKSPYANVLLKKGTIHG